jgi:hypothetical protein
MKERFIVKIFVRWDVAMKRNNVFFTEDHYEKLFADMLNAKRERK